MNKIDRLFKRLCPNGVEYKKLSEIGNTFTGLSGKSKDDFSNGNCRYITYTNIYNNPAVKLDLNDRVLIKENEKQNNLKYGDVLVAGSSENIEDSGMIAVVCDEPTENIYLNSFCFGFRFNDTYNNKIIPSFSKHIFRSANFRKQILSCSFGVTRYNLNKKKFLELTIPIPPLEIQEEIVRVLDSFGELEAELEAELEVRRTQYEYWREKLFDNKYVSCLKISDFAKCCAGATPSTARSEYWDNGTIPWMSSGEVNNIEIYSTEKKITELGYNSSSTKMLPVNTVVIALAGQGKTRGLVAITRTEVCTNQSLCGIIPDDRVDNEYLFYFLQSRYQDLRRISSGDGTRGGLNLKMIGDYEVPVPSLDKQKSIVNVLNKFSKIINSYTEGLPAEIELRKQQYEYYRNKLLSFEEVDV